MDTFLFGTHTVLRPLSVIHNFLGVSCAPLESGRRCCTWIVPLSIAESPFFQSSKSVRLKSRHTQLFLELRLLLHLQLELQLVLIVIWHCSGLHKPNSHSIPTPPDPSYQHTACSGLCAKWIFYYPLVNSGISYRNEGLWSSRKTTIMARRPPQIELWEGHYNNFQAKRTAFSELIFIGPDKSKCQDTSGFWFG